MTAESLLMWISMHKMSSVFARQMRALFVKLSVRYFCQDYLLVSCLDFHFSFCLVDENSQNFSAIFIIVIAVIVDEKTLYVMYAYVHVVLVFKCR